MGEAEIKRKRWHLLIDHLASVAASKAGMEVEMRDSECRWIFDFSRGRGKFNV
jgi:hypothetical protein